MTGTATSIRYPTLKSKIERSPGIPARPSHAFMLPPLEARSNPRSAFRHSCGWNPCRRGNGLRSGFGYAADDVHAYLEAKVAGPGAQAEAGAFARIVYSSEALRPRSDIEFCLSSPQASGEALKQIQAAVLVLAAHPQIGRRVDLHAANW